jgi:phosphoglycolate phosphatase-like HAD superfamily hydrolase
VAPSTSLRAVIFDFGGVLWDMRWDVARELDRAHGLPKSSVFETLYRSPAWSDIECGVGDPAAWAAGAHQELERRAGRALPRLHEEWRRAQTAIDANIALVRALRPPYRCSVLSNADVSLRDRLKGEMALDSCFDDTWFQEWAWRSPAEIFRLAPMAGACRPAVRSGRLGQERGRGARGRHAGGAAPRRPGSRPARAALALNAAAPERWRALRSS